MAVLFLAGSTTFAQFTTNSPIRIQQFDRAGVLVWSNNLCPAVPIYQILRANSPTGAWQHHLYLTNQFTAQVSNSLGTSNGAVFHRVALVSDAPMTFNYFYSDGFLCEAFGQIRFGLLNSGSNFWNISTDEFCGIDGDHPSGTGVLYGGLARDEQGNFIVRLRFTPGSEGYFLEGNLHHDTVNGQCGYDSMSGMVYLSGFAGETPVGTFTATRVLP